MPPASGRTASDAVAPPPSSRGARAQPSSRRPCVTATPALHSRMYWNLPAFTTSPARCRRRSLAGGKARTPAPRAPYELRKRISPPAPPAVAPPRATGRASRAPRPSEPPAYPAWDRDRGILFGSRDHFPDELETGDARYQFALRPQALMAERERLLRRAVDMPRFEPATGWTMQGSPPSTAPSRREAASIVALWPIPARLPNGNPDFPIRLLDPERYELGPRFVQGRNGITAPVLDDRELLLLMFEGSSEFRPPGGTDTVMRKFKLDQRDISAAARLQDAARIFCMFRDAFHRNRAPCNQAWFVPLRAQLARMVVGLNFEFGILGFEGIMHTWGHISWIPDNGGYRRLAEEQRDAIARCRGSRSWDPLIGDPPAFVAAVRLPDGVYQPTSPLGVEDGADSARSPLARRP